MAHGVDPMLLVPPVRWGRQVAELFEKRRSTVYKSIITVAMTAGLFAAPAFATEDDRAEWLFAHTADAVEIQEGNVLIVPMEREIFAFTDRPNRAHQYLNAHEFVALWNDGEDSFEDDPPNAVLTWVADGEVHEAEIELVDAEVTDHGRSIVYRIDPESGTVPPEGARSVSLFVDSVTSADRQYMRRQLGYQ